jgi:hypothetical protein
LASVGPLWQPSFIFGPLAAAAEWEPAGASAAAPVKVTKCRRFIEQLSYRFAGLAARRARAYSLQKPPPVIVIRP